MVIIWTMSGLFWSTDNFTNFYCAPTNCFVIFFFIFSLCRFQADFTLMDTCWVGYMFLLYFFSIGCTHVSYPNTRCLHLLVFLLLVQLSAARVKLQYFPSQVSFIAFPPALNSCHQDQGWQRWQEGEVCALCAAVHSKVFYILGNEIEETLVAQSHSKEPTQRDFLSLVTSLAGSLTLQCIVKIEDCDFFCVW